MPANDNLTLARYVNAALGFTDTWIRDLTTVSPLAMDAPLSMRSTMRANAG